VRRLTPPGRSGFALAITAPALLALALLPGGALAEGTRSADERFDALEKRVESLEAEVKSLKSTRPKPRPGPKPQTEAHKIPVGKSPVMGSRNAKIALVVFSDLQCPFCSRSHPFLKEVVEDDALKTKVKVVFKHFPLAFHKDARPAAVASLAAREQGDRYFWRFVEKAYDNPRALTSENFSVWAEEVGLDVRKFERDMKRKADKYESIIEADIKMGTKNAQVRGTPTFFVNGWQLQDRSVKGVKALLADKGIR
jgi:protein-disulfide isomerase